MARLKISRRGPLFAVALGMLGCGPSVQPANGGGVPAAPVITIAAAPEKPPPGLVAWYRFEESAGPVLDSSGGHDGFVEGPGVSRGVPGRSGKAVAFDGSGGYIRVPHSPELDFMEAGTIELWLKLTTYDQVGSTVSRGLGNNDDNVLMNTSCGNIQTIFSRSSPFGSVSATSACGRIPLERWTHIAVVNDGERLWPYVDGALEPHAVVGGFLGPINGELYIGRRQGTTFPLQGALDEIKWWRVARTQPEICADAGGIWTGGACELSGLPALR
jgi:uncharacterized protein